MVFQHELIRSLKKHFGNVAIRQGDRQITYSELEAYAGRVTRFLLAQQMPKQTLVGMYGLNRLECIYAATGILNAGGAIVPLDAALPPLRLKEMLEDLSLEYVIVSGNPPPGQAPLPAGGLRAFDLGQILAAGPEQGGVAAPQPPYAADDAVYVYFTSGTTGRPKGIVGKNCSLLQFLRWQINTFGITHTDRFSQFITPYFDAYLRDIFVPLLAGGTVCLPPGEEDFFTPEKMIPWLDQCGVTAIHCVPSLFQTFNEPARHPGQFAALRHVFLSGEKINPRALANWYHAYGPRVKLVNFYGPTEATMIRTYHVISPEDAHRESIPIGKPIDDTEVLIADENFEPCHSLEPGELYLISDITSKGYVNAPELTRQKFIPVKRGPGRETIAYRTGDRARRMPDGTIELIGRKDRQVKLRGIRIELDGIEQVLMRCPLVKSATVHLHDGDDGNPALYAFVVQEAGVAPAHFQPQLAAYIEQALPGYMQPAKVVEVERFPLLGNGKIDYAGLLAGLHAREIVPPRNLIEHKLLEIWKSIVGEKAISTTDGFHAVGGSSINMIRLIGKIHRELDVKLTLSQLFQNLTIQKLAALIKSADNAYPLVIPKAPPQAHYQATLAQERIYFEYELNRASTSYNLPMAWIIRGACEVGQLERILQALIRRHACLRTEFRFAQDRLRQFVQPEVRFRVEVKNVRDGQQQAALREFVRPFDLARAPLLRCLVLRVAGGDDIIAIDTHHIIVDGVSQALLLKEFLTLYAGGTLAPLPLSYADYAEWERRFVQSDAYNHHRDFWLKSFRNEIPRLELPGRSSLPPESFRGSAAYFDVALSDLGPLLGHLRQAGITPFSGLFAIYFLFLHQLTGQEAMVVGTATTGRFQEELENVLGLFTKTLPIYYHLGPDMPVADFIGAIHGVLAGAYSNQVYDLSHIIGEINRSRVHRVASLFDTMFVFQNFQQDLSPEPQGQFSAYHFENDTVKFPISLIGGEKAGAFWFRLEYSTQYFTQDDAAALAGQFGGLCKSVSDNLEKTIAEVTGGCQRAAEAPEPDISFTF